MTIYYTIYLSKNDEVIASGTARTCMKQMNLKSINAFYSLVSKSAKGIRKKYTVVKDYETYDEDDTLITNRDN